jgi:hypothetical protein
MNNNRITGASAAALLVSALGTGAMAQPAGTVDGAAISHVLLISIDGMHALDFENCSKGISGVDGGNPYCPNLAALAATGLVYDQASTSKPSDSFPGMTALATGATPRSAGVYYDVSYDRLLAPPKVTTPYGIIGGAKLCPGTYGTQVGFDEEIAARSEQLRAGLSA